MLDKPPKIYGLRRLGRRTNREAKKMNYSNKVKKTLHRLIDEMDENSDYFVKRPGVDFTRKRKLDFQTMMKILISMGSASVKDELLTYFDYDVNTVTGSGFTQAREKINFSAFEFLMKEFNNIFLKEKRYKGYLLKAIDGSTVNIEPDLDDERNLRKNSDDSKPYALLHLNGCYDILNRSFDDAIIQPGNEADESFAFREMVARDSSDAQTIYMADRGYECYNNFAQVMESGKKFLIRAKDIDSNGIVKRMKLPAGEEFDVDFEWTLTRKQTNYVKNNPDKYIFMPQNQHFDFMNEDREYEMKFRVVRVKLAEGAYEVLITNLEPDAFSPSVLKELYHLRWGIESSFRHLKYVVGLALFHAKKVDFIKQEIFARIIIHNFCEVITARVVLKQKQKKYSYQLNYTRAFRICRAFLRSYRKRNPLDVEGLVVKELSPIRPNRTSPRKVKSRTSPGFLYRII